MAGELRRTLTVKLTRFEDSCHRTVPKDARADVTPFELLGEILELLGIVSLASMNRYCPPTRTGRSNPPSALWPQRPQAFERHSCSGCSDPACAGGTDRVHVILHGKLELATSCSRRAVGSRKTSSTWRGGGGRLCYGGLLTP